MKSKIDNKEMQNTAGYNRRSINRLQKRRGLRKNKIFFIRLRAFARVFAVALLLVFIQIIIDLPQWYLDKNIFVSYPNDFLEIEGTGIVSKKQIFAKLKDIKIPHEPVYLTNTKNIEEALLELTPVKKVFIRRYWFPARLRIVIDERTPVLSVAPTPKVKTTAVFTDDNGSVRILDREFLPLPASKKTYKIITYDKFSEWKTNQIQYIEKFAYYIENTIGQAPEYIDIRNPDDVFVQLKEVRLRLGVINGDKIFDNIAKVVPVLPEAMKIKEDIEYIDLRWDNVSIKLKDKRKY